jgi:hypothetical protein
VLASEMLLLFFLLTSSLCVWVNLQVAIRLPLLPVLFDSRISSPPRRCCQCAEYSSRISDLENRLTLAKRQAQMTIDKASKACGLMKQISILDDEVSSLMAKVVHHEECESFIIGIIESACEMLQCKVPCNFFFPFYSITAL